MVYTRRGTYRRVYRTYRRRAPWRGRARTYGRNRMARPRTGGLRKYGTSISRNPIIADTFAIKLKYSEIRNITGGTAARASYVWRGNDIRDPDLTSAGGVVSGSAQWFGFYSDVVVLGSSIKMKIINGNAQMMQFCVYPNRTSVPIGTGSGDLREIPYGRSNTTGIYNASADNLPKYAKNYFSTAKMYCVSKAEIKDNTSYWHQVGSDPALQWFWILELETPASVSNFSWVQDVQITYYCMFKRRISVQV